jgi:hypothetical protein
MANNITQIDKKINNIMVGFILLFYYFFPAGAPYDEAILPGALGSGGGNAEGGLYLGGSGGGIINITTNLLSAGYGSQISANGEDGDSSSSYIYPNAAGGGSGGTINIIVNQLELNYAALIGADGGNGGEEKRDGYGGGAGAGGRVWINVTTPTPFVSYDLVRAYGGVTYCGNYGKPLSRFFLFSFSSLFLLYL